ncbi:MAG TPA: trypsin-like peptidase domain-containing protein, partial [Acidimicrobiales bacterium]
MPWDDDADDDAARLGPPPPADDRLWRHPSELGAQRLPGLAAGTSGATSTAPRRPASWPLAAAAGVTGALLMFGAIALTGALPERTVEQRVVEKVAMTPVVSSPALDQRGTGALARKVGPAIVRLDVVSGDGARSSVSGVVFRDDGLILTSALPLRGATTITAVLSDGRQLDASVRGLDDATDVAVVDVDADQLEVAVLGSSADLAVGDVVVALGYPLGLRGSASASSGTIQALGRMVKARDGGWLHGLVQADAGIPPGASGGALVDATGAVVGISTSRA